MKNLAIFSEGGKDMRFTSVRLYLILYISISIAKVDYYCINIFTLFFFQVLKLFLEKLILILIAIDQ